MCYFYNDIHDLDITIIITGQFCKNGSQMVLEDPIRSADSLAALRIISYYHQLGGYDAFLIRFPGYDYTKTA